MSYRNSSGGLSLMPCKMPVPSSTSSSSSISRHLGSGSRTYSRNYNATSFRGSSAPTYARTQNDVDTSFRRVTKETTRSDSSLSGRSRDGSRTRIESSDSTRSSSSGSPVKRYNRFLTSQDDSDFRNKYSCEEYMKSRHNSLTSANSSSTSTRTTRCIMPPEDDDFNNNKNLSLSELDKTLDNSLSIKQESRAKISETSEDSYESSSDESSSNKMNGENKCEGSPTRRLHHYFQTNPSLANAGLIGLRNIGNTCFMNCVIQCLSNTPPLLEYLMDNRYMNDLNTINSSMKGNLIRAFSAVINELWEPPSASRLSSGAVTTSGLKTQIQKFAPRFMGYSQQDAQEFLRYLLEGLHEDVNRVTQRPRPLTTDIDDSLSDDAKATESWKRYISMDNSKILEIFVGQLKSTLCCTYCGHTSVTFDPFWDLSLPIPVRTGQLRLQQCLEHFTKEEVLDGDEKPTCAKCKIRRKCTKRFSIQRFPKILVLHLKRFSPTERFRGKLNVTVDFPLSGLDLSLFAASRGVPSRYNLYGVANHTGTPFSGHYTAMCKHPYSGQWNTYNDSRVIAVNSRNVVSSEAYVLFYELS